MGENLESIHINPDGVIERSQETDAVLLNILKVGSHKSSPLAALNAQRKCFKIAKSSRGVDYKEYVERLQIDYYPSEFEKSELGRRLSAYIYATLFLLCVGVLLFCVWAVDDFYDNYLGIGLIGIFLLILSGIGVWRIIRLYNKIRSITSD